MQYLAPMIVPTKPVDRVPLFQIMARRPRQHYVGTDNEASAAFALARRLGELGQASETLSLVQPGRDDTVTLMALVRLTPWLSRDEVLSIERRVASAPAAIARFYVSTNYGSRSVDGTHVFGLLAPPLARVGEFDRALRYAEMTEIQSRVQALLGVADAANGKARITALGCLVPTLLSAPDFVRSQQVDQLAHVVPRSRVVAVEAWSTATRWARGQRRHEAVEVLASLAPIAATVGGSALVDEVFRGIERTLRWWP